MSLGHGRHGRGVILKEAVLLWTFLFLYLILVAWPKHIRHDCCCSHGGHDLIKNHEPLRSCAGVCEWERQWPGRGGGGVVSLEAVALDKFCLKKGLGRGPWGPWADPRDFREEAGSSVPHGEINTIILLRSNRTFQQIITFFGWRGGGERREKR